MNILGTTLYGELEASSIIVGVGVVSTLCPSWSTKYINFESLRV